MEITKWIQTGNDTDLEDLCDDSTEILMSIAGRKLDKSCAHEIMGPVMFEADDGKTYVGTVEFVLAEANPEYVKQVLEELDEY